MVGAYGVPKCRLYVIHMDAEMSSHGTEFSEKTLKTLSCSCVKELHFETRSTIFSFHSTDNRFRPYHNFGFISINCAALQELHDKMKWKNVSH